MKKFKPFTIYPPPDLKRRLEDIAEQRGRSVNRQIIQILKAKLRGMDKRDWKSNGTTKKERRVYDFAQHSRSSLSEEASTACGGAVPG